MSIFSPVLTDWDVQIRTHLYVAETEENSEGGQSKLLLRLKKNKTEIVDQLTVAFCEDTVAGANTHDRLWKLLCGVKNDILDTANTVEIDSRGEEVWLNVSSDDVLTLRDIVFDEIELNMQTVESIWREVKKNAVYFQVITINQKNYIKTNSPT